VVGETASEQVRAVDSMAFPDSRHPSIPERRISGETVHHQHGCRPVPWPQEIIDGAVNRNTFGQGNAGHWTPPSGSGSRTSHIVGVHSEADAGSLAVLAPLIAATKRPSGQGSSAVTPF